MDQMDWLHNEHMTKLSANMENLTNSIISGFALLQNLVYMPPQHVYQQTGYANFNPTQQGGHGMPYHFPDYHHGRSAPPEAYNLINDVIIAVCMHVYIVKCMISLARQTFLLIIVLIKGQNTL